MTLEQRQKTKAALWCYPHWRKMDEPVRQSWCRAVEQTVEYYRSREPMRSELIRVRFFGHATEEHTLRQLNIGHSTYQKAVLDILTTLAVYAARRGLL